MGTIGNDDKNKKPGAQNAHNQSVSAVADGIRQPLDSVNAPAQQVVNIPAINTYAQTEAIRAENKAKAAATPQPAADAKPAEATPTEQKEPDPTKVVVKTKKTADFTPYQFTATPYDADAATKKMEQSGWLTKMNDDARALDREYKAKADEASKHAKMQAWGNMFSALGQLAGAGKNTYVKPDSKYLTDALSKADNARDVYDAIKASNKKSLDAAKQAWLDADRKMHTESQENMRKFYESLNEQGYRNAANNKVETTVENNELARFDSETDRIKANASKTSAEASKTSAQAAKDRAKSYSEYVSSGGGKSEDKDWFTPEFEGSVYKADKKTAGKFADIIEAIANENDDFDFDDEAITSNLSEKVKFDRFVRKFINKYGDDPRVKEFIEKLEKK